VFVLAIPSAAALVFSNACMNISITAAGASKIQTIPSNFLIALMFFCFKVF
jgi:hypothetical protein